MSPSAELNTWLITVPLPPDEPFTFVANAVQLNVVPDTAFGLVINIFVLAPLQIAWSLADAVGIGLTVTT